MGQGSLGEVESIVSPVAEAVARELEPVQRGLSQAGAQVCTKMGACWLEASASSSPFFLVSQQIYSSRLRRWSFFHAMRLRCYFFYDDAIPIIFGHYLPSQSVRLFFQIIATDYFAMFF